MPTEITSVRTPWIGRLLHALALLLAVSAALLWASTPAAAQTTAPGSEISSCMEVKFGAKLGCTAGDVTWGEFTALPLNGCSGPGDTYSAIITTTLESTANHRYDIGIWLNLNGDSAITDQTPNACYHTYLTPLSSSAAITDSGVGPFLDADGDLCGDIYSPDGWNTVLLNQAQPIQAACEDANGNGVVDLPAGSACWSDANNSGDVCNDLSQAIPGTTSKCACNEVPLDMPITTIPWRLNIVCTPSSSAVASLPTTVSCEVVYYNGSTNITATNYSIQNYYPAGGTASNVSDGGVDGGGAINWILPTTGPGVTGTFQFSYTLEAGLVEGDVLTHTTQLSYDGVPQDVKASDTLHIGDTFADLATTITSSDPEPIPGSTVVYTVTVTNNGPASAENVTVTFDIPDGMTLVGAGPTPSGSDPLIWYPGTMTNGASQTYVVTLTVPLTPTASLTPTITTNSTTPDPEPTNNTATAPTDPLWPDLVVEISDGQTWISKGDELVYVIVVRNDGTRTADNSMLTMTLPASVTLGSASDGGAPTGDLIVWTLGNIEPGETYTRYVTVTVASSLPPTLGGLLAPASVGSTSGDLNPADNAAHDLDYITGNTLADLRVTVEDSPDPVAPGGVLVYTITVQNYGPNAADGVSLTFDLPAGLIPSGIVPTQTSGTDPLIWDIGTLSNGGLRIFVITATVPLTMSSPFTPTAVVGSTTLDPDPTNNTASPDTSLTKPDLVTTIDDGVASAGPGDVLVYTIVVRNDGGAPAANSALTFTLPASVTLGSSSDGGTSSGGTVVWPLGEMSPGEIVTRYVTVTVSPNLPPTVTDLTATATAASPSGDSNPSNNTDTDVDANDALTADLQVTLTASPDPVAPGSPLVYTIIVTNNGMLPAENVTLTLDLPPGVTLDGVTPTQTSGPDPLTWYAGTLLSGASRTYVVTVTVNSNTLGDITATATAATTAVDTNPSNNTDPETTTVVEPDLTMTVRPSTNSIRPGDTISYAITLTNTGNEPIVGTVVTATVPPGTVFDPNASTPGWTCTPDDTAGSVCTFPVGDLDPAQVDDLIFALDVLDTLPPGTTNLDVPFRATGDNGRPVSAVVDNVAVVVTYPAIEVLMTSVPPAGTSVAPGDTITYRVTITSVGTLTATGVVITAPIPTGTYLVPGSPLPTPVRTSPIVWNLGSMPPGASEEVIFVVATDPITGQTSVLGVVQAGGDGMPMVDSNLLSHPLGATAIELERLELMAVDGGIEVRWQIAAMKDSLGFHVWRGSSRDEAAAQRVTRSLIPARGIGAYSWTDTSGSAALYYWLEEIDLSGAVVRYGPITLQAPVFAGPVQAPLHGFVAVPRISAGGPAVEVIASAPQGASSNVGQPIELRTAAADAPAAVQESVAVAQPAPAVAVDASRSDAVKSEAPAVVEAAAAGEPAQPQSAAPRAQPPAAPAERAAVSQAGPVNVAEEAQPQPRSEGAPQPVAARGTLPGLLLIGIAGLVALLGVAGAAAVLFIFGVRRR